ncbi:lipase (class 2) [Limnobacter thiooxidans]|uniref:Alpha/beta fold hydrolase n=1 Tax=Limnobacter thiooxidans TaxID=131080 RepID=A0AA86MEI5_9BURK|nr:alpha/beta fold hydrolase [Limnobacter sp.]MCZ8015505.1 alpha/beta fold hydrolase [Limnobacter sp.]RZS42590.1 lipase (class 2) [Limnobacter thiooxidans]BET25975.1 alpha/beta fold hydrolase [Limnobacter thiooxidans]
MLREEKSDEKWRTQKQGLGIFDYWRTRLRLLSFAMGLGLLCVLQSGAAMPDDSLGLPGLVNVSCANSNYSPVILVHGTFANARRAYSTVAPVLKQNGFCLYALNYGRQGGYGVNGTADIQSSLLEVTEFISTVLQETGANKVSVIGHSQGGLLAFLASNTPDLVDRIDRIIAVAPSLRGTDRIPPKVSSAHCPACTQLGSASDFMRDLQNRKLNPGGLRALVLATKDDLVVTPVESQFLDEPGVTNLYLQDQFPTLRASHSGLLHVPETAALIRDFLIKE